MHFVHVDLMFRTGHQKTPFKINRTSGLGAAVSVHKTCIYSTVFLLLLVHDGVCSVPFRSYILFILHALRNA